MSLKDGMKKMSKSDESDLSRINLTDERDLIVNKIKKAKTDPMPMPAKEENLHNSTSSFNLSSFQRLNFCKALTVIILIPFDLERFFIDSGLFSSIKLTGISFLISIAETPMLLAKLIKSINDDFGTII